MDTLKEEIRASIEKNLLQQMGDVLKETLKKGAEAIEQVAANEVTIEDLKRVIARLNKTIDNYSAKDSEYKDIIRLREGINKDRANLDLEKIKYSLQCERDKTQFAQSVALGLVRNTEYRRILSDNVNEPIGKDQYGNMQYGYKSQNSAETTEAK